MADSHEELACRATYAEKAMAQIPRLLSNLDRNPYSPTYGCLHRDYWMDKTSDFPDSIRQFAAQALALVYKCNFPSNPYRGREKVRDWAVAAIEFWTRIQHRDGSFDEFYPYERGWSGPTAFTTFAIVEACRTLDDELPDGVADRARNAIGRAARFIAAGESEKDHLANHHAMSYLAVWKAADYLEDPELAAGAVRVLEGFLSYQQDEGWSIEYDGIDPGYLSATVSFLAKVYRHEPRSEVLHVLGRSVHICSYFAYPNGFYAGSLGSRNTLHFYPHGFELMGSEIPLAAAVAERMLSALEQGRLVPPEIMSDRYVAYRVCEYFDAYLDYCPREQPLEPLPYQRSDGADYFAGAGLFAMVKGSRYTIANLRKGGVVKIFDRYQQKLLYNDCGWIGKLTDGRTVTSQWVDAHYNIDVDGEGWTLSGRMTVVPSQKLFTLFKNLLFRSALWALGWSSAFSHFLKGQIRKALILRQEKVPVEFGRTFAVEGDRIAITDRLRVVGPVQFEQLAVGDEFFVRYVPQSSYFQSQELDASGRRLSADELDRLRQEGVFSRTIYVGIDGVDENGA